MGDRVLVKIKSSEEKTSGGILLPTTAQSKPQGGEFVALGEGRTFGNNKVDISVQVVYSKYAGPELECKGSNHLLLLLKEDDIVGILNADDVNDLKPLNDRVLIKVAEAEERTVGGLLLTEASNEKSSIGLVIAVGPGPLDEEGKRKPLQITPGNTVMYSEDAGSVAEVEERTAGGLLLTEASKEKRSIRLVIAVGPGPLDEEGKRKPLEITSGSSVMYSKVCWK